MFQRSQCAPAAAAVDIVAGFAARTILVIGDAIADLWVYGVPRRISREAPVLILEYERQVIMPGGAAHCARSVAALGGRALLAGAVGDDGWGRALVERLRSVGVELLPGSVRPGRTTPLKARFVAAPPAAPAQQVLRLDVVPGRRPEAADPGPLLPPLHAGGAGSRPDPGLPGQDGEDATWEDLKEALAAAVARADAIVLADYGLSDLTTDLWPLVRRLAGSRPVVVDSRHRLLSYRGATVATPNTEELAEAWGSPLETYEDITRAGRAVLAEGEFHALVVTMGPDGMAVLLPGRPPLHLPAVDPAAVYDVTGAGDTVAAVLALGLGSGLDVPAAARLANLAGSLAVRKPGTEPVTQAELQEAAGREGILVG
ncbi:MAG TPA: PfkB family carbohydrate kinase [Thermaerobacter sp.]